MTRTLLLLIGCLTLALSSLFFAAAPHALKLQVLDARTRHPLAAAPLSIRIDTGCDEPRVKQKTDAQGRATINLPPTPAHYINIAVNQPGYVPVELTWGDGSSPVKNLPDAYTLSIEPGTKISGRVLDDANHPIAGATVMMYIPRSKSRDRGGDNPERVDISYKPVKTAADGTWHYDRAPAHFDSIELGVFHPLYPTDTGECFYSMSEFKNLPALRDGSATLTLKRGVVVHGTVFGPDGKPLPGAKVGVGRDRVPSNAIPEITTDAQGRFAFGATPGSTTPVTVKSKGLAPDLKQVSAAGDRPTVEFHLQPAHTLRGRVVDSAGKPLAGVTLFADTWRSCRTLDTQFTTDADGRFSWTSAPPDAVLFDILKTGYADIRHHPLTAAGDKEFTVTLSQPLQVHGTVVDADTGKPVDKFAVIQGISWGDQQPTYWERRNSRVKSRPDGTFEFTQTYPYPGYAVRIEADGYLPAESRVFKMDEHDVSLSFKLTKGKSLAGTIKTPDGHPAANAKLTLATPSSIAYIRNNTDFLDQGGQQTTSDAAGHYAFPPQTGPYTLVVIHDAGYAECPDDQLAKSTDITLAPWGKIDGTITVGSQPGADAEIAVNSTEPAAPYDPKAPRVFHQDETKADAAGHFSFDRIRPGKVTVSRIIRTPLPGGGWMGGYSHSAKADVLPNQTARVQLGGTGRPVVGRVLLPPEVTARTDWFFYMCVLSTKRDLPKLNTPADFATMTPDQRKQWYEDFQKSDKGKAYQAAVQKAQDNFRSYALVTNRDGTFRADDVPAGSYTLQIQISKPQPGSTCGPGDTLATANADVTIPPMPTGRSDQPLDVGTLTMNVMKTVNVGDPAPDFAVKSLDGTKDVKLSDYKGKYVLLDFWATWCGPCVAETPHLKSAYDAFADNPKFAMISLSLDEKNDAPKSFAQKNDLHWTQAFLGDWSKASLPNTYGVHSIPSIWLIGPDGNVLAKDLRGDAIKTTLAQHLPQ